MCSRIKKIFQVVLLFSGMIILGMGSHTQSGKSVQQKLDPILRELLVLDEIEPAASTASLCYDLDHQLSVEVFIRTTEPEILSQKGISVRSVIGDVATAILPLSSIQSIAELSEVISIEASSVCRLLLDESIPEIKVDQVWNGDLGTPYRGEGVIVGIYDSGIDWTHPDFINDTTSRILYLWDQTVDTGPHPDGFFYGTEYTQTNINNEIDETPEGIVQGRDSYGHGTHVAGIAAGNGRAGEAGGPIYKGVAPEADLIVVKGGDEIGYTEARIIDGIHYIFQKAEGMNPSRPAVVNLSVGGTHRGPHDGTSSFETRLDTFLFSQEFKEGRAIVVAAGNDGDNPIHFLDNFESVDTAIVTFQVDGLKLHSGAEDYVGFDIWYHNFVGLSATIVTPQDSSYGPFQSGQIITNWGRITATVTNYPSKNESNMHIYITERKLEDIVTDLLPTGTWQLILTGHGGPVEGWLYDSSVDAEITSEADYSHLINEPGNARFCITVGSYISRLEWPHQISKSGTVNDSQIGALSDFSSPGPKRNSSMEKPDIVAPGEYVVSAFSSDGSTGPEKLTPDGLYRAWRGTSMAAPHVTGVIALMFQADPELDASEIKSIFINTARRDDEFTGTEMWNAKRGYGKLDALEALRKTSVENDEGRITPESFSLSQNYPNPFNGSTVIAYTIPGQNVQNVTLELYDVTGRKVRTFVQGVQIPGHYQIGWDGRDDQGLQVGSGVYVYQLRTDYIILSKKLIYLR